MPATGGLKLTVESASRHDRRGRFAHVRLAATGNERPISLVTDADGRMRHRLADGEYELSVGGSEHVRFSVRDQRWTTVRIHLT